MIMPHVTRRMKTSIDVFELSEFVNNMANLGNKKLELAQSPVVVRYLAEMNNEARESPDLVDQDFS